MFFFCSWKPPLECSTDTLKKKYFVRLVQKGMSGALSLRSLILWLSTHIFQFIWCYDFESFFFSLYYFYYYFYFILELHIVRICILYICWWRCLNLFFFFYSNWHRDWHLLKFTFKLCPMYILIHYIIL